MLIFVPNSMWRDPDAVQTKTVIKADPTAPARSSIRREPTVRHRNNPISSRQQSHGINPGVDRHALLNIIRRDHQNGLPPGHDNDVAFSRDREVETAANVARRHASDRVRVENDRAILRDSLSYERPAHRSHGRESALRYEMRHPEASDRASGLPDSDADPYPRPTLHGMRSPPPEYMPTPPYATGESHGRHSATPPLGNPSLTPRFAPAYRLSESADYFPPLQRQSRIRDRQGSSYPEGHSSVDLTHRSPPLRRNRHRDAYVTATEYVPRTPYGPTDGLGDRRRSFSPEESTWETLLTTITPDERLPSAQSSFTSATAPTSSLSSNSASSSATISTAPSSRSEPQNTQPTHICDESTDSECSDSDDDYSMTAQETGHRTPALFDPNQTSATSFQERWVRAGWDLHHETERARRRSDRDLEFQQVHAILDRMDRDEPVPDEWWAAAGLSRNLAGRFERSERERL